ncbi:MAG TPA: hypothetical protein VK934_11280 [Fimbriimonas sp.]|nr:hypothetical protein [Fimbriimonas sp.]
MLGLLALAAVGTAQVASAPAKAPGLSPAQAQKKLNQKATRFIQNAGQWDAKGLFLARANGLDMWVTRDGMTYDFYRRTVRGGELGKTGQVVQMSFAGGNEGSARGVSPLRMTTQYVDSRGNRSADSYREVLQKGIYAGIDARSYFDNGLPRYDLVVAPGANPNQIKLAFKGADKVSVQGGEIVLGTKLGAQKHGKLFAYQLVNGRKQQVAARFTQSGARTVSFELGAYDHSKQLVIDPLIYGSYYGGDGGQDEVHAVTSDTKGGVYMTGYTMSPIFPAIYGPYGFQRLGGRDGFISKLQGDAYAHDYAAYFGGAGTDLGMQINVDPFGDVWIAGLTNSSNFPGGNLQYLKLTSSTAPTGGTFTITYPTIGTTSPIPYNAGPNAVRQALISLLGVTNIKVLNNTGTGVTLNQGGVYKIILPKDFAQTPTVDSSNLTPTSTYSIPARQTFVFVMRWAQSATTVLTPFPQAIQYFGGEVPITLAAMKIVPNANPTEDEPVRIVIAGNQAAGASNSDIADVASPLLAGYTARWDFDRASRAFLRIDALTKLVSGSASAVDVTGLDVDRFGSVYVGGSVSFNGAVDTAVNPVFVTTPGVYADGRLLRNTDLFVRKYASNGNLILSSLIGGNRHDFAGGYSLEVFERTSVQPLLLRHRSSQAVLQHVNTGSILAVDEALNIYITGQSNSFNFPRTREVYGEIFSDDPLVTVTKINADASQIVYSTNLRTTGKNNLPAGIDVDSRGDAFVTGNIHLDFLWFNENQGSTASDPNEPITPPTPNQGTIQLTADALDPDFTTPLEPEIPTMEGWINVLNDTATDLIYGSYIGGLCDDRVFAPFVDQFGDVWTFGQVGTNRSYGRFDSTLPFPNLTSYNTSGALADAMITEQAFKRFPDKDTSGSEQYSNVWLGKWNPSWDFPPGLHPTGWDPNNADNPPVDISFLNTNLKIGIAPAYLSDGFIIKQRIGLAAIQSITLNPLTAPGGLGVQIQGTVTLSDPAPAGGAELQLSLSNPDAATINGSETVFIPAGQTTGTFTISTQPVTQNTNVQLRVSYQGSFKIAQFVVVPWLQQLALSPTSVVGGNQATGRITLAAPAPTGGVTVDLSTDTPSLISFPTGSQVVVPAGQTSVVFTINTEGVAQTTFPTIRASLLGVGKTQTLTLTQANLKSVVLSPSRVAGGTTTTGTVFLDGKAGSTFTVNINIDDGTPGYVITPKTLTFEAGDTQQSFTIKTAFESSNTSRKVTAVRPEQTTYSRQVVSTTLFVDAVFLTGFTLNPTTINGGEKAQGVVTISAPAPSGGVVVNLKSSNSSVATVPSQVIVPAGASTGSFDITGQTIAVDKTVTITATRGTTSIARELTVKGVTFTMSIQPGSVVGGRDSAMGQIVLSNPAPAGGVTIKLKSSNTAVATVPDTIVVPAGETVGTYTVATTAVSTTKSVTITATLGTNTVQAGLEVRPVGVEMVTFTPNQVQGGNTTLVTITLEAPAPAGGANVTLSASNPDVFVLMPASVQIAAGQTSVSFTVRTVRVARDLASTLTATYNGSSASATLTVTR